MPCPDIMGGRVVKGLHFVDQRDAGDPVECARAYCEGGRTPTGIDPPEFARAILLTSKACDGAKTGHDIPLTRGIAERVSVPVIASGGAGKMATSWKPSSMARRQSCWLQAYSTSARSAHPDLRVYVTQREAAVRE